MAYNWHSLGKLCESQHRYIDTNLWMLTFYRCYIAGNSEKYHRFYFQVTICAHSQYEHFSNILRYSKYMEIMGKDPLHLLLFALLSIANSYAILLDFISFRPIHSIHFCVHCMFSLIFSLLCESAVLSLFLLYTLLPLRFNGPTKLALMKRKYKLKLTLPQFKLIRLDWNPIVHNLEKQWRITFETSVDGCRNAVSCRSNTSTCIVSILYRLYE